MYLTGEIEHDINYIYFKPTAKSICKVLILILYTENQHLKAGKPMQQCEENNVSTD